MRIVNIIRNAVGIVLLVCALLMTLLIAGFYTESSGWLIEVFGQHITEIYLLMIPLGLLHALLALPGGARWEKRLLRSMVMKLLLIPMFVINYFLGMVGAIVFFLGGLLMTYIALAVALSVTLATSVDIIRALITMRIEGRISTGQMIKHSLFQLIFCLDIIDAIVLFKNQDKYVPADPTDMWS